MTDIKFRPLFPSPLGYCNFGNANKIFNKRLIDDIEDHMHKDAKGRPMSGAKHTSSSKYLYHFKDLSATAKKKAKR